MSGLIKILFINVSPPTDPLRKAFSDTKFFPVFARGTREILNKFQHESPNILIFQSTPVGEVLATWKQIQSSRASRPILSILLLEEGLPTSSRTQLLTAGFHHILPSRITPQELVTFLEFLLSHKIVSFDPHTLCESLPFAFLILEENGRILHVNRQWEILFGSPRTEALGKPFENFLPEQFRRELRQILEQFRTGEKEANLSFRLRNSKGSEIHLVMECRRLALQTEKTIQIFCIFRDTTDINHARMKQKVSDERLEEIVSNIHDIVYIVDGETEEFTYLSPAFEKVLGYTREDVKQMGGRKAFLSQVIQKGGFKKQDEGFSRLKNGEIREAPVWESWWRRKDGSLICLEDKSIPVYRGNKLVKTLGILRDVTERKQYARMLRDVNKRLQAVLDASQQIIFMKDRHSIYQTVNKTFERYFGISSHYIIGKDDFLLFNPEEAKKLQAEDRIVFESGNTLKTEVQLTIRNRQHIFRSTKVPIRNDQNRVVGLAGFAEDITELVEKEKELFKLSQMLERSPISVIITDAEGRIEYVNPYFTQLTGYSQPEVLGKNPRIWKSQEHPKSFYTQLWRTIKQGNIWQGEILNRKKNGELYWENVTIGPVRDESGQITNFVAFKIDITEKKSIELQYQQAQKMEAVGRLAGGVAHDFNNILTVINGYCELILRKLKPKSSFYNEIVAIARAGQKANNLTNQLLAFSRRQIIQPRVLNLNDVITDTVKMLKRLIGEDIELKTILEKHLPNIRMDPGQLEQILMNLVVNARDAMPRGGTLIIETQAMELDESYIRKRPIVKIGQYIMLAVTDTGIGMDSRTQARIFEPFFTTKSKGKGTGLGLSTVYGIVKQNNGYIWVYSEPHKGTTFKIYLPVHHGEVEARTAQEDFQTTGGYETILLVEDDTSVRELTREILENAGYQVLEAANGNEAIRIFQQHREKVELLLSDVVMPRMSGSDLLNRLKEQKPGLKAVFMSGYTDNAIVHHGVLEKHTHFIQKPFSPGSLLQKIREALDSPASPE